MASPTRLIVRGAPLPTNFKGTLNQFYKAMLDRLEILSPFGQLQFQVGGVKPVSNVGPWLKDGTEWWVWDESLKDYVPISINSASFESILAAYYTKTEVDTLLSGYSTTSGMNAAIAAAVSGVSFQTYRAQGTRGAGSQSIPANGTVTQVVVNSAPINPSPSPINTGSSRYVAPAAGDYVVAVTSQYDNNTATASGVEVRLGLHKNGADTGIGDEDGTPAPNGLRWSPSFTTMITLGVGDYLELFTAVDDGVGSGAVNLTTFRFNVWRIA